MVIDRIDEPRPLVIGPRVRAELVGRRVRELEARFRPSPGDLKEVARLKEFLKSTAGGYE